MEIYSLKDKLHPYIYTTLCETIKTFRPAQVKSIEAGLLEGKNLLVCTPTASGKTLVAEIAMLNAVLEKNGKAVYIVPLKALASEKYNDFRKKYSKLKVALSIGDKDSSDNYLQNYDIIITVSEKLDSLIRHRVSWINFVHCVVIDEIHLLDDPKRGPTLEILLTILKKLLKKSQFIALSATIGNPEELAEWLDANLVMDDWRPVELKKGIYLDDEIKFL